LFATDAATDENHSVRKDLAYTAAATAVATAATAAGNNTLG